MRAVSLLAILLAFADALTFSGHARGKLAARPAIARRSTTPKLADSGGDDGSGKVGGGGDGGGGGGGGNDGGGDDGDESEPFIGRGITWFLGAKSALTLVSGLPVLLSPSSVLDDLGFPLITKAHVLSTKMWGVWQCFFQFLLEFTVAFFVPAGLTRNLLLLCEGIFEIGLAVDVHHDFTTANSGRYSKSIHDIYVWSPPVFFAVLLLFPDPVTDVAAQLRAYTTVGLVSACILGAQVAGLQLASTSDKKYK
mmetsp:Transcript_14979/g.50431  ORF Transcript_14979/g.50431 Transcript_14979/m.50431 type:complete len:252 (-) Transcript_14979:241-996(-)